MGFFPFLGNEILRKICKRTENSLTNILNICTLSQVVLVVKSSPANAGDERDTGLIPESGRSPGEGNGNPLQHPCLEHPMDGGAWWGIVREVTMSQTRPRTTSSKLLAEIKEN